MSSRRVHLVGGAGYIGTALQPYLRSKGWEPNVLDLGIHGNVSKPWDARKDEAPDDDAPVIWLASAHLEPGENLSLEEHLRWVKYNQQLEQAFFDAQLSHPIVGISSTQVLLRPHTAYGKHKREIESMCAGVEFCACVRLGTVMGGLDQTPSRPQTLPNALILNPDRELDVDPAYFKAFVTRIEDAVYAIHRALVIADNNSSPIVGTTSLPCLTTTYKGPDGLRLLREVARNYRGEILPQNRAPQAHPTKLLADKVGLPYPA